MLVVRALFLQKNPQTSFGFFTTNTLYTTSDSVVVVLDNQSNSNIIFTRRSGKYLEMYFQKKENNEWSNNLWFWWMSLKSFSKIDTLQSNTIFNYSFTAETFDTTGIYRLVIEFHINKSNSIISKFSNSFEVR